jgi:hypothetical protein
MKPLLFFAPLFRPRLRSFALALLLSLITIGAGTALLGVSGWFLTATALTALGVSFNLFAPSAAVRGFSFIRILSRYFEKLVGHNATLALLSDIRRFIFERLFPRAPLPARSLRHGDLVSRLTADVDALDTLFLLAIGPLLAAFVIGGIVTTILFVLLPVAGWIYLLTLLLSAIAIPLTLVLATRRTGAVLVEAAATMRTHVLDATMHLFHPTRIWLRHWQLAVAKPELHARDLVLLRVDDSLRQGAYRRACVVGRSHACHHDRLRVMANHGRHEMNVRGGVRQLSPGGRCARGGPCLVRGTSDRQRSSAGRSRGSRTASREKDCSRHGRSVPADTASHHARSLPWSVHQGKPGTCKDIDRLEVGRPLPAAPRLRPARSPSPGSSAERTFPRRLLSHATHYARARRIRV